MRQNRDNQDKLLEEMGSRSQVEAGWTLAVRSLKGLEKERGMMEVGNRGEEELCQP